MRILFIFWLAGVTAFGQPTRASTIAITHVTVINPGTSSVQANRTVAIIGGRIASVSDAAKVQPPNNARVIDATGQYLMPGLWEKSCALCLWGLVSKWPQ